MCGVGKILVDKPGHGGPFTNPILVTPQSKASMFALTHDVAVHDCVVDLDRQRCRC